MSTQNKQNIRDFLQVVIDKNGLDPNAEIKIVEGSQFGDGFLTVNSAIEIACKNKPLKLFVKEAPHNEKLRKKCTIWERAFAREIYFYDTVYREFTKFQCERNIKHPFKCVPNYCAGSLERNREILALENLKDEGYVMFDKREQMNDDHLTLVLKEIARFHAVSFAMKDQDVELFRRLGANLDNLLAVFVKEGQIDKTFIKSCEDVKKIFHTKRDRPILEKFKNLEKVFPHVILNSQQYCDKYSIIIHGDLWCNNIMFKYKDMYDRSIPSSLKFVDWQLLRVNSPVIDVSHFFYSICPKNAMDNLDHYLSVYYDTLTQNMRELGTDPDKVYPFDVFKEHWRNYSRYGMMLSFLVIKSLLADREDIPCTPEAVESGETVGDVFKCEIKDRKLYNERVRDIVEHFIDYHYF